MIYIQILNLMRNLENDTEDINNSKSEVWWEYFDADKYAERIADIENEKYQATREKDKELKCLLNKLFSYESENKSDNWWDKIEWYFQTFNNNPDHFAILDAVSAYWNSNNLWETLEFKIVNEIINAKDKLKEPSIYQAAAFLLVNVEKWGSPYRWLSRYENSGIWIKALLGKSHYEQFMRDKEKCINELSGDWKEKDKIQDALANCEMNYIVNNIRWSNWKLKYFWYHSSKWRGSLPSQFADSLSSPSERRFNKSSVKESYEKIAHTDFNLAKYDFERLMKSSRFPWALGNLAKMLSLSKNEEQKSESQKAFLICMLSGVLDFNGNTDMKKQVYSWWKTLWFLPGMLAKNVWHSEQVVALLDDFSQWDFSKKVKSFFHRWDLLGWETKIWNLIEEVNNWWSVDMMNKFENYSRTNFLIKKFPSNSALAELQKIARN